MVRSMVRVPTVYGACALNQRWPAAPADSPAAAYEYQPRNASVSFGSISIMRPWPLVAVLYHAPDSPKSLGGLVGVPDSTHSTFGRRRSSGIVPARPSSSEYANDPVEHESNVSVPVPTCTADVIGPALKLPPVFW